MENIHDMERALRDLKKRQISVTREWEAMPEGVLNVENRKGKQIFFQVMQTKEGKKRRVITNQPALVRSLARKRYLEKELDVIQNNIFVIHQFLKNYTEITPDRILAGLTRPYCKMDPDLFFPAEETLDSWEKEPYEKGTYMQEHLTHTTTRGLKVRSKSELIIAESLYRNQISFRYEQVLHIAEKKLIPDFVIKKNDGSLIYWEHCGLTNNEAYMHRHKEKLGLYEKAGIVPWKNLIVTYDEENGTIDLAQIEAIIKIRL